MLFAAFLVAVASSANAAVWNITVGGTGLVFTPDTATPAVGDTMHFIFGVGDHSVTQSTFAAPCSAVAGGFDSGFQNPTSATPPTFDLVVNSTDPIWIHCAQVGHCPAGMVFAANAPSSGDTFANFQAAAMGKSVSSSSSTSSAAASASSTTAASAPSSGYGGSSGALASSVPGWIASVALMSLAAGAVLL